MKNPPINNEQTELEQTINSIGLNNKLKTTYTI